MDHLGGGPWVVENGHHEQTFRGLCWPSIWSYSLLPPGPLIMPGTLPHLPFLWSCSKMCFLPQQLNLLPDEELKKSIVQKVAFTWTSIIATRKVSTWNIGCAKDSFLSQNNLLCQAKFFPLLWKLLIPLCPPPSRPPLVCFRCSPWIAYPSPTGRAFFCPLHWKLRHIICLWVSRW